MAFFVVSMAIQWAALGVAAIIVIFFGVYGYFVESLVRIGFSVYQVLAVLGAIVLVMAIDIPMFKGARSTGAIRWGTIAPRSQYVLILLAVTFTWLMGLMGFARSGIRQHWHVYGVLRDNSVDAVTPALGYAANMPSPFTGSGMPMTAASATAGWLTRALSTSAVPMRCPATLSTSSMRPMTQK